jgi:hypothetical protein
MNMLENILASKQLQNCMHQRKFILTFFWNAQQNHN